MTEAHETSEPKQARAEPAGGSASASADGCRRARRRGGMLLYVALLIAGVVAAWQGHEYLRRRGGGAEFSPPASGAGAHSAARSARGRVDPRDLRNPLAGQGLGPLKHDPGLLPAPAGAAFQFGMHRTQRGIEQYLFRYTYKGSPDDVRAHYAQAMAARHLPEAKSTGPDVLVFGRGSETVVVRIRPAGGRDGVLVFGVTWTRMGRTAAEQGARQ